MKPVDKKFESLHCTAPSFNNLKHFTLSGVSVAVKIIKKQKKTKTETHLQQKRRCINTELQKRIYKRSRVT